MSLFQVLLKGSELDRIQKEREERRKRAIALLPSVSLEGRDRFVDEALVCLLDAGWYEGRRWEAERIRDFEARFSSPYPDSVSVILMEFGGLEIGFGGRSLLMGDEREEHVISSRDVVSKVVGSRLYPVGETDLFDDHGLGVYLDDGGRVYVAGISDGDPPEDYMVELMTSTMDEFLNRLFDGCRLPRLQSWSYTLSEAK